MSSCASIFRGTGVALITPFHGDDGTVDHSSLRALVARHLAAGIDFLCILCTTSETPCLSPAEQQAIVSTVVDSVHGAVPLLRGVSGSCTATVVEAVHAACSDPVDGLLVACPSYNRPSQEGLYQHFSAVAAASSLPIIMYNIPSRTGVNMLPATVARLARDCKNIVGIKESCGKLGQIKELIAAVPPSFTVLSGDDALTREMIMMGAKGAISVCANAFPQTVSTLVQTLLKGDYDSAYALDATLQPLYHLLFADGNPAGIKALLSAMGVVANRLRLPLTPVSAATATALAAFAADNTLA